MNEQFKPLISPTTIPPADLETALDDISDVVKKTKDSELLIKLVEILRKMSDYSQTGDKAMIEGVVIDLAIILNKMSMIYTHNTPSNNSFDDSALVVKRTDLLYYGGRSEGSVDGNDDGRRDKKTLLKGFYEFLVSEKDADLQFRSKKYSSSVAACYKSYLNTYIVKRSGCIDNKGIVNLYELMANLMAFVSQSIPNDIEGNELKKERNVKSAARLMIDYLNYILSQQSK